MSYLIPSEFVTKRGEAAVMSTRDTLINIYLVGAILAFFSLFRVAITVPSGAPILGAFLFTVGFFMLNSMNFDRLEGVFALSPLKI